MSAIYFCTEKDEVALRGSERHYGAALCTDMLMSALRLTSGLHLLPDEVARYRRLFPANSYVQRSDGEAIKTAIRVGDEFFVPSLNTAMALGSDPVRLLARLHGQCEIHAYVEGEDRAWLADMIEEGREFRVLRSGMGWEKVAAFLRADSDGPVVTSYSVCDSFPNKQAADFDGDYDAWEALPESEQWSRALAGIRAENGLRLQPSGWADFVFGDGTNAFDLLDRIEAAA